MVISKNSAFAPLPEELHHRCSHGTLMIILLWVTHSGFHSCFHQREGFLIKSYVSLALGRLGFVSCRHLFKSAFASGYCALIKKAELTVSSENMPNALCYGKSRLSGGKRDNVRGEYSEYWCMPMGLIKAAKHRFCPFLYMKHIL